MNLTNTQCCAAMEMYGMGKLEDPKQHLLSVCKQMWPVNKWSSGDCTQKIYSHYIFHGVVKYEGYPDNRYSDKAGTLLAKFIRKNKLGTVVGSKPEWNRVNHPDHQVRVWVWTPDDAKLKAWYKQNRPPEWAPGYVVPTVPTTGVVTFIA